MERFSRAPLGVCALLAMAAAAAAQDGKPVTTLPDRTETVKLAVSGRAVVDMVFRGSELTAFTDSFSRDGGAPAVATSEDETTGEGYVAVRFDVELTSRISAVVEVGTVRVDGFPTPGDPAFNRYGTAESIDIVLRELRVLVQDFFVPDVRAEIGITTWSYNVRGKGGSIAFDPRRSSTFTRNLDSDGIMNVQDDAAARLGEAAFVDPLDPVGIVLTWSNPAVRVDVVILPMVIEGGSARDDEAMYAVDAYLNLDSVGQGSRLGAIAAMNVVRTDVVGFTPGNQDGRANVWTVGLGAAIKAGGGAWEFYAEGYLQGGEAGEFFATGDTIDAKGNAVVVGVEWKHLVGNPTPVWAGVSFMQISGDGDTDPTDDQADKFASYESVSDLLILEDPDFGFDWDSNYRAIKISGGTSFTLATENDLDISFIVGITRCVEDVVVPGGTEDALGNEVDLRASWHVTKQVTIKAALGLLFGSDVLEGGLGGPAADHAEDNTQLFVLGMDVGF